MNKKKLLYGILGSMLIPLLYGCGEKTDEAEKTTEYTEEKTDEGFNDTLRIDEKEIIIPGVQGEYEFVVVNDQHIIQLSDEYTDEKSEEVEQRYNSFRNVNRTLSSDAWMEIVKKINEIQPDGVILDGDMVDFFSESNLACLKDGLDQIQVPTMYVRADHDLALWYNDTFTPEYVQAREKEIWPMEDVMVQEFEDFLIVGINNNTSQLSENGLERIKEIWKRHKPVVLAMHVPLESRIDRGISNASKEVWQDRALIWGENSCYVPDEITKQFLDMVYEKNSPVVAVLGAHLHFAYEDQINDNIKQYVFDASYKGTIGLVTVKGELGEN